MPRLSSEDLVWDIRYHHANENWYYYRMALHWQGVPVINPAARHSNTDGCPQNDFIICHDGCDGLRHIFDYALATGRPVAWNSIEPDSKIAIYPGMSWPFCGVNGGRDFFDLRESYEKQAAREAKRLKNAFDPDGQWTFMIFTDTERLKDGDCITGDGIIFSLSAERRQVERFRGELEQEYELFSESIGYREPENYPHRYRD